VSPDTTSPMLQLSALPLPLPSRISQLATYNWRLVRGFCRFQIFFSRLLLLIFCTAFNTPRHHIRKQCIIPRGRLHRGRATSARRHVSWQPRHLPQIGLHLAQASRQPTATNGRLEGRSVQFVSCVACCKFCACCAVYMTTQKG